MAACKAAIFLLRSITLLPMNFAFGIHAFDSVIRVQCPDAEILDFLKRYIFPPLPRCSTVPEQPGIDLDVRRTSNEIEILLNGKLLAYAASPADAALAAIKALDELVVHRQRNLRAIHAGAVLIEGKALLIPGSTHAGKSSLVAELLRCGASCFSDEYALIDKDGRVHAYPRPLLLRNGRPQQSLVLPQELGSGFAEYPAPVGWIVAVDYGPENQWSIQTLSQGEAVMLLLRNTPHEMAQSPELVDFFLRVSANATCYQGTRGSAEEAVTHLRALVHQGTAQLPS